MQINNIAKAYGAYQYNKSNILDKTTKTEEKKDVIALSSMSKDFSKVKSALLNTPNVRMDKVEALKKKYESGEYNIDADLIADKIISDYFA